jgi:hypothetical protein
MFELSRCRGMWNFDNGVKIARAVQKYKSTFNGQNDGQIERRF